MEERSVYGGKERRKPRCVRGRDREIEEGERKDEYVWRERVKEDKIYGGKAEGKRGGGEKVDNMYGRKEGEENGGNKRKWRGCIEQRREVRIYGREEGRKGITSMCREIERREATCMKDRKEGEGKKTKGREGKLREYREGRRKGWKEQHPDKVISRL